MSRVVVITGSTRGIGRGLAHELLARGAAVVVSGRSGPSVEAMVAELGVEHDPARVHGAACDVVDPAAVQALWDAAVTRFGRVDIWINNAGVSAPRVPMWEIDPADIATVVDTNLVGLLQGCHVALAGMVRQGSGYLYNLEGFGSTGQTVSGMATYGATKKAVAYLTSSLRKDLKGTPSAGQVKVGSISPGIVITDLLRGDYEDDPEGWEKAKRIFNILGDHVETVTPFLADQVLANDRDGKRIAWLTGPKVAGRFATAKFRSRDLFADETEHATA